MTSLRDLSNVVRPRAWELRADGELVDKFRTYEEAQAAAAAIAFSACDRYSIDKRVGGRLFNYAFGYRAGTTSTADLAAMGVPIAPTCISVEKL
jgi:hypothetical protein